MRLLCKFTESGDDPEVQLQLDDSGSQAGIDVRELWNHDDRQIPVKLLSHQALAEKTEGW